MVDGLNPGDFAQVTTASCFNWKATQCIFSEFATVPKPIDSTHHTPSFSVAVFRGYSVQILPFQTPIASVAPHGDDAQNRDHVRPGCLKIKLEFNGTSAFVGHSLHLPPGPILRKAQTPNSKGRSIRAFSLRVRPINPKITHRVPSGVRPRLGAVSPHHGLLGVRRWEYHQAVFLKISGRSLCEFTAPNRKVARLRQSKVRRQNKQCDGGCP